MMKKGQTWISAVLYTALGIILITIILNSGIPLLNKIKDRNLVIQTKEMLHIMDENIRSVALEGPGSKRFLSPVSIERGELIIEENNNLLRWKLETKNKMMEPNIIFDEGALKQFLNETITEGEYIVNLEVEYEGVAEISLISDLENPFTGTYSMTIEHNGTYISNKPIIVISMR
jgi:hypothetical protein|tara:strand:+ start:61819 stop:62343 length:525 start_codon:yes stop_codon:yes gene_type:complete